MVDLNAIQVYDLPTRRVGSEYSDVINKIYRCWKEVWEDDRKKSGVEGELFSDDFLATDRVTAIFYQGECVGLTLFQYVNFEEEASFDKQYFSVWGKEHFDDLTKNGPIVAVGKYFTIHFNYRKQAHGINWKDTLFALGTLSVGESRADVMSGMLRVKKGMGRVGDRGGVHVIGAEVPYYIENEYVNLIALYQQNIGNVKTFYSKFVMDLWNKAVVIGEQEFCNAA